jgi:hypothetical protein
VRRSIEIAAATAGIALAGLGVAPFLHRLEPPDRWMLVHWPRDLDEAAVRALLRHLAATRRPALLTLEVRSARGQVRHYVGTANADVERVWHAFATFLPEVLLDEIVREPLRLFVALEVRLASRERPLRTDDPIGVSRSVIAALAGATGTSVLQFQLGGRLAPLHVPRDTTGLPTTTRALSQAFRYGLAPLDATDRRNLQAKIGTQGYQAVLRVGTNISEPAVGKGALQAVLGGLRTAEAAGAHFAARRADPRAMEAGLPPRRFPIALNIDELVGILGWPLGDANYPGVTRQGARRLPVPAEIGETGCRLGEGTHPATRRPVALDSRDGLMHVHVIGPTGTGKSTLLAQIAIDTITAGHGLVVVEPKGDLVADVLARMPAKRERDVIILDPSDRDAPVGLNPLAGGPPELVSDQVMAVLRGLYGDALGPRSADVIHAALLTLARSEDATLVALPLLLTDPRLRRDLTKVVRDDLALGPFWAWYEGISDDARAQVIGPVMNKLRPFILRENVRHILGQPRPRFDIAEVFTHRKVLLVPLAKGSIGEGAAGLLGSLAVARLWRVAQSRSRIGPEQRTPVTMIIDEFQDFLHLPTDLADVLAQARGLGLGLVLAHQHFAQLTPSVRAAVLANARSRVAFRLGAEDAATLARTTPLLDSNDFQSLPRFEAYAAIVANAETQPYCSIATRPLAAGSGAAQRLRATSRDRYGVSSADIEQQLRSLADGHAADGGQVGSRRRKPAADGDGYGGRR